MKRKTQTIIVFGSILLLLALLPGCGIDMGKYVGKWVHQSGEYNVETLEIKSDGTYSLYVSRELGIRYTTDGTWEIEKDDGEEWIIFSPPLGFIAALQKKGNMLVEPLMGTTYVKQD